MSMTLSLLPDRARRRNPAKGSRFRSKGKTAVAYRAAQVRELRELEGGLMDLTRAYMSLLKGELRALGIKIERG